MYNKLIFLNLNSRNKINSYLFIRAVQRNVKKQQETAKKLDEHLKKTPRLIQLGFTRNFVSPQRINPKPLQVH